MEKQITFQLGILKIKDLEFSVNEELSKEGNIGIRFSQSININIDTKIVEITLSVDFLDEKNGEPFLHSKISNQFLVPEIENFKNENNSGTIDIPDQLLYTILGLSVSHSRAIISKNSSGTAFSDVYLPIINPTELAKQLFKINE